mgnify:CR=1 FL=1
MRVLITGGAGFIGSHIVDYFMEKNEEVIVIDNLSSGRIENIEKWLDNPNFKFHKADLTNPSSYAEMFSGVDIVFHYAANSEVRIGSQRPEDIWDNNIVATYNVLEAMRKHNVKLIVFASSSTVYGDQVNIPTPENSKLEPISIYGASKLAGEALISGYVHTFKIRALIMRYANIVGSRLRHGVIYDFISKLKKNPEVLEILGDGMQRKSYLYISDAIEATMHALNKFMETEKMIEIYNVGNEDWITVKEIAEIVSKTMNLKPKLLFTGGVEGGRGWIGDVKLMLLDISKLKAIGWKPKLNCRDVIERATKDILELFE